MRSYVLMTERKPVVKKVCFQGHKALPEYRKQQRHASCEMASMEF